MPTLGTGKKYRVIYADPPWPEQGGVHISPANGLPGKTSGPDHPTNFSTMTSQQIRFMPVRNLVADSAVLFLWTTARHVPLALQVVTDWGFRYINIGFAWMKSNTRNGRPFAGIGAWTKQNVELCLLGTRGAPMRYLRARNIPQAMYSPRRPRTVSKPIEIRRRIEFMFPDSPKLELFAREVSPGWDVWGNEVPCSPSAAAVLGDPTRALV